jgi:hypothetical protein
VTDITREELERQMLDFESELKECYRRYNACLQMRVEGDEIISKNIKQVNKDPIFQNYISFIQHFEKPLILPS